MKLIKTSMLNAIAVSIKMLAMLMINKILAFYVGPAGYAVVGQFQNAIQIMLSFASGAFNAGVVKYTAEYYLEEDREKQHKIWRTAGTVSLVCSLVVSFISYIGSSYWSEYFFSTIEYTSVFKIFSFTLVFFVLNNLFVSILNGKKEIISYVAINISGSILSVFLIFFLVDSFGLYGVLLSLATYQSVNFIVAFFILYKKKWFKFCYIFGSVDKQSAKKLFNYTIMALTSAICIPLCHMAIRQHLGENIGWSEAGYWEAMWRISSVYLLFVTSTLSVYYLPRLSEIKEPNILKNEIVNGYKYILPCTIILSLIVYACRDFIIPILFTKEFYPIRDLFFWQLIGDSLKIGSWIVAYTVLAKNMTRFYVISEIFASIGFYSFTILFSDIMGLEGVSFAYALNYAIYWVLVFSYVFYNLNRTSKR